MNNLPKYDGIPLTFEEQASRLIDFGLPENEKKIIIHKLKSVNYARLKEYWTPFLENKGGNYQFKDGTTFDDIWQTYRFDRKLRLIVYDAIERIEISIRTLLVESHTTYHKDGFAYTDISTLINTKDKSNIIDRAERALSIYKNIYRNEDEESVVKEFKRKYSNEFPPFWISCENMDFGNICTLFKGVPRDISRKVFEHFNVTRKIMKEWLNIIRITRNICAHHSRLWNRSFTTKFIRPKKETNPEWYEGVVISENRKLFPVLTLLAYMLQIIIPESEWKYRIKELLEKYPHIKTEKMGFPEGWEGSPIWA